LGCPSIQDLWNGIPSTLSIRARWHGIAIEEAWNSWWRDTSGKERNLPLLISWEIWIARNEIIFTQKFPHWPSIHNRIIADYHLIPEKSQKNQQRIVETEVINKSIPWDFFDGSTQEIGCGGGAILYLSETHSFKIQMGLGRGTNNYAKLITAKKLSFFLYKNNAQTCIFLVTQNWL